MLSFKYIHNETKMKTILAKLKSLSYLINITYIQFCVQFKIPGIAGDLFAQKCAEKNNSSLIGFGSNMQINYGINVLS